MLFGCDSPRPDIAAYISANGFDELEEEASIAVRLDLKGFTTIFFFANILSVVSEAEFDVLSPRPLNRAALSDRLDNVGSPDLGIGLIISKDEATGRSTS